MGLKSLKSIWETKYSNGDACKVSAGSYEKVLKTYKKSIKRSQ